MCRMRILLLLCGLAACTPASPSAVPPQSPYAAGVAVVWLGENYYRLTDSTSGLVCMVNGWYNSAKSISCVRP